MQQIGLVLQDTIAQNEIMISMIGFRQQNLWKSILDIPLLC